MNEWLDTLRAWTGLSQDTLVPLLVFVAVVVLIVVVVVAVGIGLLVQGNRRDRAADQGAAQEK